MFSSLKNQTRLFQTVAVGCALALLSGCGQMLGSGGRSTTGTSNLGTGSGGSTGRTTGGSTATRTPNSTGTVNTAYDQTLQVCDQYRAAGSSIQNACGGFFQQNIEELSSGCAAKFQDLYNIDCTGLKERLQGVFNACGTDISQGMSYFPANCQTVLRKYVR